MIGQKTKVGVQTTTKTIKLSVDDNDFKIAHPSDFVRSDDNDKFFNQLARVCKLLYRYRCVDRVFMY
jgi:hypothetical protein